MRYVFDLSELMLEEVEDCTDIDRDALLLAILAYHVHSESFHLEQLIEDEDSVTSTGILIDSWYCEYYHKLEDLFGFLRSIRRHAISKVSSTRHCLMVELQPTDLSEL